jgi:hypothetical protein
VKKLNVKKLSLQVLKYFSLVQFVNS